MKILKFLIGSYITNRLENKIAISSSEEIISFLKDNKSLLIGTTISTLMFVVLVPVSLYGLLFSAAIWGVDGGSPFWDTLLYSSCLVLLGTLIVSIYTSSLKKRVGESMPEAKENVKGKFLDSFDATVFAPIVDELRSERTRYLIEKEHEIPEVSIH